MNANDLRELLLGVKTIAVVGLSDDPSRDSFHVSEYMRGQGYIIIPVNPNLKGDWQGIKAYDSLRQIPEKVDLVDVFRRSPEVPSIVEDAIAIGARAIWLQDGVVHEEAAERARAAGMAVVMDDCILRQHRRLVAKF